MDTCLVSVYLSVCLSVTTVPQTSLVSKVHRGYLRFLTRGFSIFCWEVMAFKANM